MLKKIVCIFFVFPLLLHAEELELRSVDASGGFEDYSYSLQDRQTRQRIRSLHETQRTLVLRGYKLTLEEVHRNGSLDLQSHDDALSVSDVYVYPNPFRQSMKVFIAGDDEEYQALLGYKLSGNANIDMYIYDMLGRLTIKRRFLSGSVGGAKNYNLIDFTHLLKDYKLSTGVYFVYLVHEDKVVGKTKFGVKP
ncbi:MAG: T9SS type A sorting domain-containing protein [bacterium]